MWAEICKRYVAVIFIGLVIKLLDDEVDQDQVSVSRAIQGLQKFKLPYCLLFLGVAMTLDRAYSFSLFSSAYIIGMFPMGGQLLPLKLKAYQEALLVMTASLLLIPFFSLLHGFLIILLIQLIDDIFDISYDQVYGYHNYCIKFGRGEVIIFCGILFVGVFLINWINTVIVLPTAFLINYLYHQY